MPDDLFAAAASKRLAARAPLADRMRPTTLDEVVGQEHLLGPGRALRRLIEADRLSSAILWGPAGTGKTTLARLVARTTEKEFASLSAVDATVKDVREVLARSRQRLGERGQGTILFLDEVHRFSKSQQDALLPAVEEGLVVLIGATTENPHFTVNPPLLSRSTLFRLEPLGAESLQELVRRGLEVEEAEAEPDAVEHLILRSGGDGRQTLTALEVAVALALGRARDAGGGTRARIEVGDIEAALGVNALRYGRDEHYDVISAFIKSIRGSDPDAGIWWLATMLEAGEDARFIARRLVILASEDIGMADPTSLLVAEAASRAVDHVGLPEAQLNLAQAVIHLATAPKSNRVTMAIGAARAAVRDGPTGRVPAHLRDTHYQGAAGLGHGMGYAYPHDDPRGWVAQQHLPDEIAELTFYEPSAHGHEADVRLRMHEVRTTAPSDRPGAAGPDQRDGSR
ncbi:replication-associated recombination protein A [Iamia sp.]|uniref:replication-associated recombination protein A n=1 Tax=Iamia sp. TaxID=2722710 RepID=UPI002CBD7D3B|nr:replication-associated recombination protein A [Iamia sp.]HXH58309.1 replication-associated recombination protein A [Iamia sp.]